MELFCLCNFTEFMNSPAVLILIHIVSHPHSPHYSSLLRGNYLCLTQQRAAQTERTAGSYGLLTEHHFKPHDAERTQNIVSF